ncbi:MAG: MFS transporter [Candidatus Eremiobacteraeota bacterium]|nr:MFS transporter [Candidatus Eremiobacteraeota bacterium]
MRSAGFWVLVATILGSSLVFIDGSVVSIALPVIQTELHASSSQTQWIVEGYTLVLGALMLLSGALADRYGRKRIFLLGVVIFALGSLGCGLAPSIDALLWARVIQGIGGTMLAPASLALIGAYFEGEARGKAVGTWSAFSAIAAVIGPVLGGAVIDHFGWRWVFAINVPFASAIIVICTLKLKESRDEEDLGKLDIWGSAAITLSLAAIVYAFIAAGLNGWTNPYVIAAAIIGPLALGLFVWVEAHHPSPIMPLRLFRGRTFTGVNLLTLVLYGALGGMFYFLPFVLIRVMHYSATFAGFATIPFIIILVALSRTTGALTYRFGARLLLTVGPSVVACGFLAFSLLHGTSYWTAIFPGIMLIGLGMGLTVAPLTTTMMESVEQHRVGLASGINNAISRVAGLLTIAIFGVVLATFFNSSLSHRLDDAHVPPVARAQVDAQRPRLAGATLQDARLQQTVLQAYDDGFRTVAFCCAFLAGAGALCAALLIEKRPQQVQA